MLDLLILGNLIVDDVVYADGSTRMRQAGGAVLYAALAARLFGARVGVVNRVGDDYPRDVLDELTARGVALTLRPMNGPGLRIWLLDEGARRQVVHRLSGPSHEQATPTLDDIPEAWRAARAVHLAPAPLQRQRALLDGLAGRGALLSLDPFALLRDDALPSWRALLGRVDALFVSRDELLLSKTGALALQREAVDRRATLVLKRGAEGGQLWHGGAAHRWRARANQVVETTGAGDAFAAGFLTALVDREPITRCVARGVVAASFALEDVGPQGLLAATPAQADARLRAWYPNA